MTAGQIVDLLIIGILLVGVIRGWFVGLAVKVGHVVALIASCIVAHIFGLALKGVVAKQFILPVITDKTNGLMDVKVIKKGAEIVANRMAYQAIFLVVFAVALLILNRVVHLLKIVDKIPVVGTLNQLGGALLGLVTEFIIVYVLCAVIFTIVPQRSLNKAGLTKKVIRETHVLQFFIDKQ